MDQLLKNFGRRLPQAVSIGYFEADNVLHARQLADQYPALTARDLLHVSVCHIHQIEEMKTFDRNLRSVFRI